METSTLMEPLVSKEVLSEKKNKGMSEDAKEEKVVKIFVVDDDPLYCKVVEKYLENHSNYKIYSFQTGEECFKQIPLIQPDIVILDYCLNDDNPRTKDGIEILKRLKRITPQTFVLMLSGQESFEVVAKAIKFGAFDYVVKNESAFMRLNSLINKILSIVSLKRLEQKQERYAKFMIIATLIVLIVPGVWNVYMTDTTHWIILSSLLSLIALFLLLKKAVN